MKGMDLALWWPSGSDHSVKGKALNSVLEGAHQFIFHNFQHVNTLSLILVLTTEISSFFFLGFSDTAFLYMTSFQREILQNFLCFSV